MPSVAEQNAFNLAKADFDKKSYPAAQAEFQAFLGTYAASSLADQANFYLGRCKYEATPPDYAGAIATWKALLTAFPRSAILAEAQYWIGRAYFQSADYATARTELQKQLTTYPNNAFSDVVGLYLARCDFETRAFAVAQAAITQLITAHPGSPYKADMLYWRGRAQWEQQAFPAAKADFDTVTSQFTTSVLADNASYWADRCLFSQALLPVPTATWPATVAAFTATRMAYPASNVQDWVVHYLGRSHFYDADYPNALSMLNLQLASWAALPSNWAGHYWRGRTYLAQAVPDRTMAIVDFDVVINTGKTSSWYDNAFEWKAHAQADTALCPDAATTYSAMKANVPGSTVLASTCAYVLSKCPTQVCP